MVTWLFSTFSRAMHGLHFQLTSDWFATFYTFVTVGSWFGFVSTVRAVFNLLSKVIRQLLCFWFWFYEGLRLGE